MAGKPERTLRSVAPVHAAEEEIGEYRSKDLEFDWPFEEHYEPPYPLTARERELVELNKTRSQENGAEP